MKTEENEAFDDLARKQGDWGGGFQAKRQMAADKQEPWNEDEWRRNNWRCGHGWLRGEQCEICNAAQPAQEPVTLPCCECTDVSAIKWNPFNGVVQCHNCGQVYTASLAAQTRREWVGLTYEEIEELFQSAAGADEETVIRFARLIESKIKEKNT